MTEYIDSSGKIPSQSEVGPTMRVGAEAGELACSEELPQTVWLMGTEPWFDEFSLEADQVMGMLGIKRTRLTQISGRELRVGRVRRGRYISPVFRPKDVESYLNWSRAPVSHIKSSTMLNEAADALKQQADDLEHQFSDLKEIITKDFESGIRRALLQTQHLSTEAKVELKANFVTFSQQMSERLAAMTLKQNSLADHICSLAQQMEKLQAGQMTILKCLQESQIRTADELGAKFLRVEAAVAVMEESIVEKLAETQKETPKRPDRLIVRKKHLARVRTYTRSPPAEIAKTEKKQGARPVRLRMLRSRKG